MSYNDQNFGNWEGMDDPDMRDFYFQVQRDSVEKVCAICGETVRILPQYDKCNACTEQIERGGGF